MRILVIGSGGREHALAWKIAQSRLCDKLFCAPGNGGIASLAECVPIRAEDTHGLCEFAVKERIGLTVVGPEVPLALGVVDEFRERGLVVFGPEKKAARLEASKVFAKELMAKYGIPTAGFCIFDDAGKASAYIESHGAPCVIKAEGLAAGKGVVVAATREEALEAVRLMMQERVFKEAGSRVIVEERLIGQEASILAFTDSRKVIPMASSQDHKRIGDGDQGPNTGGMGAYSPAPVVGEALFKEIVENVIYRTIDGLAREGIDYRGVLYAGIMITPSGPKVLEFNVRFGDPETQAILPLMKEDLVEVMLATAGRSLTRFKALRWDSRSCVCVVMASAGYPGEYQKDKPISGLEEAAGIEDAVVFHAGTLKTKEGYRTSGGRVLGVTGLGATIRQAIDKAYSAVRKISFEGMQYRHDIGKKALQAAAVTEGA